MSKTPNRRAFAAAIFGLILAVSLAMCTLPAKDSPKTPVLSPTESHAPTAQPSPLAAPAKTAPMTPIPTPSIAIRSTPAWEGRMVSVDVAFDNYPLEPRLRTGWGFAAWLEYGETVVLFDTGADGAILLDNMSALGLDPQSIDIVVLSHDHDDHTDRLADRMAASPKVTVYVPRTFPARIRDRARSAGASLVEVDEPMEIQPGLWTTGQMGTSPLEQALVARTAQGLIVVTGCAHPGVDRMVARAQEIGREEVRLVVGGFHLGGASQQRIREIVAQLRRLGVHQVAPSHCTGDTAKGHFRSAYGDDYYDVGVGWRWESEAEIWLLASQGIPAQVGVSTAAVAPSDTGVVYLAAYEPGGLYRSADGGRTWQAMGRGLGQLAPLSVAVHPADPDVAWVGTVAGGFRTTDGGQNWDPMLDLPLTPIYALATALEGRSLYAGGEAMGVWHSDDGGRTWLAGDRAGDQITVLSLAIASDGSLYAGTAGQGLWASDDGGIG